MWDMVDAALVSMYSGSYNDLNPLLTLIKCLLPGQCRMDSGQGHVGVLVEGLFLKVAGQETAMSSTSSSPEQANLDGLQLGTQSWPESDPAEDG